MPEKFKKPYDHTAVEGEIYKKWEESGYFNPDNLPGERKESFSMVLPPPNVTGTLHLGHAYEDALQDAFVRFERMRGKKALWVPGADSAAIATQAKVENELYKKEKKTRYDIGRDELLARIEAFTQESRDTILNQVRRVGSSLDWSRFAYTMDGERYEAVIEAFVRMFNAGLIYRGDRIVNWDPKLQTTVSDDEIEYIEETTPFYYFKYGPFTIGTVRPETKFGDKYVVMHPNDERYKEYTHGQKIEVEWINGPITATVIKDEAGNMEFGSGVMTITPAHSSVDFDIAQRHGLDYEQIIDDRGILLPIAGEFAGQHIKKVRAAIVEKLKAKGLVEKIDEKYTHNVATNSRGGGVIEPQIKRQWFVAVNKEFERDGTKITLKKLMRDTVESGKVEILPEHFEKIYYHWIDNLRDWCISRQIWFGHRIPVWYCLNCKNLRVNPKVKARWYLVRHGQTELNAKGVMQGRSDSSLTSEGRKYVEKVAQSLAKKDIGLIVSSNLGRCKQTSEIISAATGAEIIYDEALQERDFRSFEGTPYEAFTALMKEKRKYNSPLADEETYEEIEKRAWKAFNEYLQKYSDKNVVMVSHGGTMRVLLRAIRNLSYEEAFAIPHIQNGEIVSFDILEKSCENCGNILFEQDPDTLDTWFSSALWPFSTLGWPKETPDLRTYLPNTLMAPGYEILFFWVARMILASGFLLNSIPFKTVFLHGIVRDKEGRKFSKSLGNGIDPIHVIEKYGADALRMSLLVGAAAGSDIKFDEARVKGYKLFANKLWNVTRFVLEQPYDLQATLTENDKKLWDEFETLAKDVTKDFQEYRLYLAAEKLYHYLWDRLAAEILEESKPILKGNDARAKASRARLLVMLLSNTLKLLHPFMPFITEEIWSSMPEKKELLMIESWPV
ncbi:MAG TPA: class I tRNA ligase family protein [Candidatus Paceibacterota bacterium]|nr:class I tRNA ligase family protein [Candidatus Paceibacterota bacterium]